MDNNIEKKPNSQRLLMFMADWAEDLSHYDLKQVLTSLNHIEEAFLDHAIADDQYTRRHGRYVLSRLRQLVKRLKKKEKAIENLHSYISDGQPAPVQ